MYTLIEYPVGVVTEAVVLSLEADRLRVAAAGFPDVLELRRSGIDWVTEEGQKVELGFLQNHACIAPPAFQPGLAMAASAAVRM